MKNQRLLQRLLQRTPVHVIRNEEGSIYKTDQRGICVTIRQVETWKEEGQLMINEKIMNIVTDRNDLKRNTVLPGNICKAYTVDVLEDEYLLLDRKANPIETLDGNLIYTFYFYDPHRTYMPIGEIDENLNKFIQTAKREQL